jgi:carbonic anhydrase
MRFMFRPLATAGLLTSLALASSPSWAADVEVKTSPRKVAVERGPQPVDPMDKLRERLAAKLGSNAVTPEGNPNVLQVSARPAPAGATSTPVARMTDGGASGGGGGSGGGHGGSAAGGPRGKAPASARAAAKPVSWAYEGPGGPAHWAQLKPEFSQCGNGSRQSPIDIRDGISVQLDPVQFDYQPSRFGVVDTGRTVQVNVADGNSIEVMGRKYKLVRFDFQHPSEERIDGRQFDMGVHLVHQDDQGRTAIVAVLLDRGAEQPVIQSVWNNLPLEKGDEVHARTNIDLNFLLPTDRRYFTYMGSMTTPPCKEGVLWMVMKNPVAISSEQLAVFSRLYKMNARPVQAASGRLIKGP